jgi:hypothetical protein
MENLLLQKAKEKYGTVESCKLSTYLLPDGKFLNSSKFFNQNPDYHLHDLIVDKIQLNLGVRRFVSQTGVIRYHPTREEINISLDINHPITEKQLETLETCSCFLEHQKKPIIYDFYDKEKFIGHNWTGNEPDCFKGIDKLKKDFKEAKLKELRKLLDAHWEATAEERKRTHTGKIYDKYMKEKG